ncbi:hypothetical protein BKA69DRAFT_1060348 [Paraphysoderma sedebokerense]|nr:hypothetical protein BKA69DRAFT_1060348 [Paraphysoderma sedebokerense]
MAGVDTTPTSANVEVHCEPQLTTPVKLAFERAAQSPNSLFKANEGNVNLTPKEKESRISPAVRERLLQPQQPVTPKEKKSPGAKEATNNSSVISNQLESLPDSDVRSISIPSTQSDAASILSDASGASSTSKRNKPNIRVDTSPIKKYIQHTVPVDQRSHRQQQQQRRVYSNSSGNGSVDGSSNSSRAASNAAISEWREQHKEKRRFSRSSKPSQDSFDAAKQEFARRQSQQMEAKRMVQQFHQWREAQSQIQQQPQQQPMQMMPAFPFMQPQMFQFPSMMMPSVQLPTASPSTSMGTSDQSAMANPQMPSMQPFTTIPSMYNGLYMMVPGANMMMPMLAYNAMQMNAMMLQQQAMMAQQQTSLEPTHPSSSHVSQSSPSVQNTQKRHSRRSVSAVRSISPGRTYQSPASIYGIGRKSSPSDDVPLSSVVNSNRQSLARSSRPQSTSTNRGMSRTQPSSATYRQSFQQISVASPDDNVPLASLKARPLNSTVQKKESDSSPSDNIPLSALSLKSQQNPSPNENVPLAQMIHRKKNATRKTDNGSASKNEGLSNSKLTTKGNPSQRGSSDDSCKSSTTSKSEHSNFTTQSKQQEMRKAQKGDVTPDSSVYSDSLDSSVQSSPDTAGIDSPI